jgi:hypothetical protein
MNQNNRNEIRSNSARVLIARWFGYSQTTDHAGPASDGDLRLNPAGEQPDYGAYNEAFVMHHWASFGPRF